MNYGKCDILRQAFYARALVVAKDHESVLYSQEVLVAARSGHEKQAAYAIAVDVSAPLNGQYRAIPYPMARKYRWDSVPT
jgi:hypothetical protein